MKNKIIFTQDVPGEREFLQARFPGHACLETVHSGKWATAASLPYFKEIPFSDSIDKTEKFDDETYVSLFDSAAMQNHWLHADNIVSNIDFSVFQNNKEAYQVLTFGRVGTVFVESLFDKTCRQLSIHTTSEPSQVARTNKLLSENSDAYVVLTYRNNWWDWLTSTLISNNFGFHHYDDQIDWDQVEPFNITEEAIQSKEEQVISTWNFFLNTRLKFPNHSFYLLEFSEVIKRYQTHTAHRAMSYDKRKIIKNYDQAEEMFNQSYLSLWKLFEHRAVKHLINLQCRTDLDNLFDNQTV